MKETGFTLSNYYGVIIKLALEPEGMVFELQPEETIEIEFTCDAKPVFDLQVKKDTDGIYFALWSENGKYKVLLEGKEVLYKS